MKCKTFSTLICLAQIVVLYLMVRSGGWADREINPRKPVSANLCSLVGCLLGFGSLPSCYLPWQQCTGRRQRRWTLSEPR